MDFFFDTSRFSLRLATVMLTVALVLVGGCASVEEAEDKEAVLTPSSFTQLPGWTNDDFQGFMEAYRRSCSWIVRRDSNAAFATNPAFGTYAAWQENCRKSENVAANDPAAVRGFIEQNFKVMQVSAGSDPEGLFTGYYESTLRGSRTRHGPYQYPLHARPDDLVMLDLGEFREELRGQRLAGRVRDGRLRPYESRAEIVAGKLPAEQNKPLVWLDDPHDAFFVQIQGSGIVHLDDGSVMRIGYAGQNGHPYYAIGRELVRRGIYQTDEVSMDSIRRWLRENPDQADDLMNSNPSYVFFTEMVDDGTGTGPQGGEGVRLTEGRSLAIDRSIFPYGFPVWLSVDYTDLEGRPINRLMMAQDTGGAIRGPVRGDYFWGSGEAAEAKAGPMKAKGRYWFLIPR